MSGTSIPLAGVQPNILGAWQAGANIANTQAQALQGQARVPLIQQQTQGAAIQNSLARLGLAYQRWWYGTLENSMPGMGGGGGAPGAAGGASGSAGPAAGTGAAVPAAAAPHPAALAASPLGDSPLTGSSGNGQPAQQPDMGAFFQRNWGGMDLGNGFSMPRMSALFALKDPTKAAANLQAIFATKRQQVITAMQQANTPEAWNNMVIRENQLGWISPDTAQRLWNGFGNRDAALASVASPDAQLAYSGTLFKGGAQMGPGGAPVPSGAAAGGQYGLSSGRSAGENINLSPTGRTAVSPLATALRNGTGAPAVGVPATSAGMATAGPLTPQGWLAKVNGFEQPTPGINPTGSTATGPYGFTAGTWASVMPGVPFASASNSSVAGQAALRYAQQNATVLQAAGMPINASTLGAAHFLGAQGALALMRAPANAPIAQVLPQQDIDANRWIAGLNAGQVAARIVRAYGTQPVDLSASAPPVQAPAGIPGVPGNTSARAPANAFGAPGTTAVPGAAGGETLQSGLTPAAVETQKINAQKWTGLQTQYAAEGSEATQANTLFDQIKNESQSWTPGTFATWRMQGQALLDTISRMAGGKPSVPVGDYQAFVKNGSQLAAAATRAISARPAAIEFTQMLKALPNPEMSPQGISQVASELQGMNDWKIVRAHLASQYDGAANPTQFGSNYTNTVPIAPFILNRLSVPEAAALHNTLMKTPAGRATWNRIFSEYGSLSKAGLFNLLPGPGS